MKKILLKIIQTHLDLDAILSEENNYKSKILSWGQKYHKRVEFKHAEIYNQSSKKIYKVQLIIDNNTLGEALDYTTTKAEQVAAANSWELIEKKINKEEIPIQN